MSTRIISHAIGEAELSERFGAPHPQVVDKVKSRLTEWMTEFIRRSPFMVLATSTSSGACDVSPKGGGSGFVAVLDEQTLLIPDYAGNNLFFGHKNVMDNPRIGMLFLIPGEGWTVRVNGRAQIVDDEASMATLGVAPHGESLDWASRSSSRNASATARRPWSAPTCGIQRSAAGFRRSQILRVAGWANH